MPEELGSNLLKYFPFADGWRNVNSGRYPRIASVDASVLVEIFRPSHLLNLVWSLTLHVASFGVCPTPVLERMQQFQKQQYAAPDRYFRYEVAGHLNKSRAVLAKQVNAPLSTIVMIPNATTAINVVMRNLKYEPNDVILYFSTTYGACQNIILATVEFGGCKAHRIDVEHPLSDDALLQKFEDAVDTLKKAGQRPKILLFDTFCSMPGVRMPYERLIEMCKKHSMFSIIDGAHGYGHVALDLTKLDADFFVTNIHKWGFVPLPSALFYVPERNQNLIRTSFPTSHYYEPEDDPNVQKGFNPLPPASGDDTAFTKMFEFVGTADTSSYYCIPAAAEFRRDVCGGDERIWEYCRDLARKGGEVVARKLGTEVMDNPEKTLTKDSSVVNIRLPLSTDLLPEDKDPSAVFQWGQKTTMEYNTFIPFYWHAGAWWTRLNAQVYLELDDFEFAADTVLKVCQRIRNGEHLPM